MPDGRVSAEFFLRDRFDIHDSGGAKVRCVLNVDKGCYATGFAGILAAMSVSQTTRGSMVWFHVISVSQH